MRHFPGTVSYADSAARRRRPDPYGSCAALSFPNCSARSDFHARTRANGDAYRHANQGRPHSDGDRPANQRRPWSDGDPTVGDASVRITIGAGVSAGRRGDGVPDNADTRV